MKILLGFETENGDEGFAVYDDINAIGSYTRYSSEGFPSWTGSFLVVAGVTIYSRTSFERLKTAYYAIENKKKYEAEKKKYEKERLEQIEQHKKEIDDIKSKIIPATAATSFESWLNTEISDTSLLSYGLSTLTINALRRNDIYIWNQIYQKSPSDIARIRGISPKTAEHMCKIFTKMKSHYSK